MKLCKDCKYFRAGWFTPPSAAGCVAPQTKRTNLQTGEIEHYPEYAVNTRRYFCGEDAEFWSAK